MGFSVPDFDDPNFGAGDDDVDDGDLEAELEQLQRGAGAPVKARPKPDPKKSGTLFSNENWMNHGRDKTYMWSHSLTISHSDTKASFSFV